MTTTTSSQPQGTGRDGTPGIDAHQCAQMWTLLRSIYTQINGRLEEEFGRQLGITVNEFEVLFFVSDAEPGQVRLGDVQAASPLSQPALSRLVARLEAHGLICRTETAADRRVVLLAATDAGRDLIERSTSLYAGIIHAMLVERMTDDEQHQLVQTLSRVISVDPATG
jgi:DNA-binding MarR family transcriptional regulator